MSGWNEWMDGWNGGRMSGLMEWMDGMDGWRKDEWMEWMDGQTDGMEYNIINEWKDE